jgi:hypothetical protein
VLQRSSFRTARMNDGSTDGTPSILRSWKILAEVLDNRDLARSHPQQGLDAAGVRRPHGCG